MLNLPKKRTSFSHLEMETDREVPETEVESSVVEIMEFDKSTEVEPEPEERLLPQTREFQCFYERNPIESIKSRIKSPESILQKMQKKGLPPMVSCMMDHIFDIAGIRVVCPFLSDVYQVAQLLVRQPDIELIETKDYIQQPKKNGYRSLHLIVEVTIYFAEQRKEIPVEIQLRTIAMDFWASTEHQLRYKKNLNFTDEMQEKLLDCARAMEKADQQMQEIANITVCMPENRFD